MLACDIHGNAATLIRPLPMRLHGDVSFLYFHVKGPSFFVAIQDSPLPGKARQSITSEPATTAPPNAFQPHIPTHSYCSLCSAIYAWPSQVPGSRVHLVPAAQRSRQPPRPTTECHSGRSCAHPPPVQRRYLHRRLRLLLHHAGSRKGCRRTAAQRPIVDV